MSQTYGERRGLPEKQVAYIKKITQPQSIEDVSLALKDPNSPLYKDMMNMLLAQMNRELIIEKIVEHYLIQDYLATQQEKEELQKAAIRAEKSVHEHTMQMLKLQTIQAQKSIEKMDIPQLEKQKLTYEVRIKKLDDEIKTHKGELKKIEIEEKVKVEEWHDVAQERRTVYSQYIAENHLSFSDVNGDRIDLESEAFEDIVDARAGLLSPAPIEVLRVVNQSILTAREESDKPEEIMAAPQDAAVALGHADITNVFKTLAVISSVTKDGTVEEAAEPVTGAALLALIKKNKKTLAEPASPGALQQRQKNLMGETIALLNNKNEAQGKLGTAEKELAMTKILSEMVGKQLKAESKHQAVPSPRK